MTLIIYLFIYFWLLQSISDNKMSEDSAYKLGYNLGRCTNLISLHVDIG